VAYDDALGELYQVPLTQFVAERKRLAGELKSAGDAAGAKQLLERKRPTVSAWVVNQLYWHARDAFDQMLATAEQLRNGHLKASGDHRDAIAKLRKRAATMLEDSGHTATEATLRRVTTTLSALAATGGFDPDPPGALAADRDPPGFEAVGIIGPPPEATEPEQKPAPKAKAKHDDDEKRRHAEAMAQRKREEDERKRRVAERHKLEVALHTARANKDKHERAVSQLEHQLERARKEVDEAGEAIDALTAQIAELDGKD
jgi:hypothetical protein